MMRASHLLLSAGLLGLGGCTLGPDYHGPASPPPPASFARAPAAASAPAAPRLGAWWQALGDPLLDATEAQALAASPTLAAARARIDEARARLAADRAARRPSLGAQAAYLHADLPGSGLGGQSSLDFYNNALDASWEADLWGAKRRTVEASRARAEAAEARLADAQVALSAEVARRYIALRDAQTRLDLARRIAALEAEKLALVGQQASAGAAAGLDLARQQTAATEADRQIAPLEADVAAALDALAVLVSAAPGALDARLAAPAPVPLAAQTMAVGDPAGLIARRPDVRAAERDLAAAVAGIGAAQAASRPTIKFTGFLGLGGANAGDAFDPTSLASLIAPQLSWSFLDFGRNRARLAQARATRAEAEAQYRAAMLGALQDAEDGLARYGAARSALGSAALARASALRAAALTGERRAAGAADRLQDIDAQHQALASAQALSQARAALSDSYVTLAKALGLGWQ